MKATLRALSFVGLGLLLTRTPASGVDRFAAGDFTKPEFFPILPWDPLHGWDGKRRESEINGLESIAQCHFNLGGFVRTEDLRQCRDLGLGALLLPPPEAGLPLRYQRRWKELSDDEIDRRVRAMVKYAGRSPAVKGYFIMDEPGVADFPALGKAVTAVKKYAPGKLAYINLFPDYATLGAPDTSQLGTTNYTEYLERFVAEVQPQILSYDNYMVEYSDDLKKPVGASYFRNLAGVRRVALAHGLPYLQVVAANQLRPGHTPPSPANLALQAYTTLAAGFRGVTWYTYFSRGYHYGAVDAEGRRTATWSYLSEVNRQVAALAPILSRLSSTGIYFSEPAPADGLPLLPGKLIGTVTASTPVMVGEFRGPRATAYALVVNLSLAQTANLRLTTEPASQTIQQVSAVDGGLRPFDQEKDGFWLPAGQGVLLKLGE